MVKIVVDCFGGDHSPEANVDGAVRALAEITDLSLILTGDEEKIRTCLEGKTYDAARLSIVHAPEVVGVDEKPTDVIRLKRESSMMKAVKLLREDDEISGMVSTGSTGALVAAGQLRVGRIRGVIRPAFCPVLPTMTGGVVGVCDSGANVDITPDHLVQQAIMGSLYMQYVYGIANPRVALLNIGVEEEKGDDLRKETYGRLKTLPGINFVGNMESRDFISGDYDLVVCDGFSGNVLLKSTEGTALELLKKLKKEIYSKGIYKIGALLMKKMFADMKEFMNYQNYGGSVLLGTAKTMVKGHGSSKDTAVYKCIEQAYKMGKYDLNEKISAALPKEE
jgi:glycerol-3-phosphate acyltransferase PlsX